MAQDVLGFGAKGDARTDDTKSIQRAIDACGSADGGTVQLPPGRFLSGPLYCRSGVGLHLEEGAVLLGSPDPDDYRTFGGMVALINGDGISRVAIDGAGEIDGHGAVFWTDERLDHGVRKPAPVRPPALVRFTNSRDVRLSGITLVNSPCYTVWLLGCEDAVVEGVTIDNPRDGPNTDGIDLDCCRRVRVAGCAIRSGDDCIAVKSDIGRLGRNTPCEDITVKDCELASTACGVRVGYEGDGVIRRCTFDGLSIRDTDIGLDVVSVLPGVPYPGLTMARGARIEGVHFLDVAIDNVHRPLFIWLGNETDRPFGGSIRDVSFSGIRVETRAAGYIGGAPGHPVEDVALRELRMAMVGEAETGATEGDPDVWGARAPANAIIARHVRGLELIGATLDWSRATGQWGSAVCLGDVEGFTLAGYRSAGHKAVSDSRRYQLTNVTPTPRQAR